MNPTSTFAASTATYATVIAEDAPIGVLLWTVRDAKYAPNFTLESVAIVRTAYGTSVVWTYENGNKRHFTLGEQVTVLA